MKLFETIVQSGKDLDVRYGRVHKLASIYLISKFCSFSNIDHLSWKTNFKIIIKNFFLFLVQNLMICLNRNTTFVHDRLIFIAGSN